MAPTHADALSRLLAGSDVLTAAKRAVAIGVAAGTHSALSRRGLTVSDTQKVTLGVIAAYIVAIALLWNLPYIRWVLWPFKVSPLPLPLKVNRKERQPANLKFLYKKMLVIAFHEFGHALAAVLTGGRVKSISLDPHEGGVTHMLGGKSAITLPAGYLGSSLIGALLTFCGFDIVASKVASIVLGVCFLLTLWWARRDWLTIMTVLLAVGLLVACWFIDHALPLRFVVVSFFVFLRTASNVFFFSAVG